MPWCPAIIKTPMHPDARPVGAMYPLGRVAEISEIADAILYLDQASFVTGEPFPLTAARAVQAKRLRVLRLLTLKYRRHHRPIDPKPHLPYLHIACKQSARVRGLTSPIMERRKTK
jgi:hypothetical protein